jgi:hypothetical protein
MIFPLIYFVELYSYKSGDAIESREQDMPAAGRVNPHAAAARLSKNRRMLAAGDPATIPPGAVA